MIEYEVTVYVNEIEVLTRKVRAEDPEEAEKKVMDALYIECDVNDTD